MTSHRKLLAVLHAVSGVLTLMPVLILLPLFGGITGIVAAASDDPRATAIVGLGLGAVLTVVMVAACLFGLFSLVAAYGLWRQERWGDVFTLIASVINLPNFPLGTALGVYGLWVVLIREPQAFGALPRPDPLSDAAHSV
jgi:hypothetical protein